MVQEQRDRITFHQDLEIIEIDFTDLNFSNSTEVNQMYDCLEEAIAESGYDKWFFLVNYSGTRIDSSAWFAFSRRGRDLNLAHSQGSVRLDASEATRQEIERRANTEEFDANLHATREGALERISTFKSQRLAKVTHEENMKREDLLERVTFEVDDQIMEINFSNLTFKHSDDVNLAYDFIHECVDAAGPKWYFLVNYENCHIYPEAWIPYSQRGKVLNIDHSLGSVRYAPGSEEEEEIRMRAESQEFRPNIRNTREEALERIAEMKAEA